MEPGSIAVVPRPGNTGVQPMRSVALVRKPVAGPALRVLHPGGLIAWRARSQGMVKELSRERAPFLVAGVLEGSRLP